MQMIFSANNTVKAFARYANDLKGSIENILSKEVINAADSDDYLHITLTDKDNIIDAMDKVRSAYPNVMQLEFERDMKGNTKGVYEATGVGTKPDNELFL